MARRRRYFESGGLYEVTIRARAGLPFPCRESLSLLIKSALARTQRDLKVRIVHFIWMGNHAHILVICSDAVQLTRFYGELQKKLTDYMKRLLDLNYLDLWEGSPSIIRIADLEAAKERVAYFYANPARANLVDSIDKYPGYSSFKAFLNTSNTLLNRHTEKIPWIRCPTISKAPTRNLSVCQDQHLRQKLLKSAKTSHRLTIFPNLWMSCFGISTTEEIREVNKEIYQRLRDLEAAARESRQQKGFKPFGANVLSKQPLMLSHTPKKYSRRIFVIARNKEIRVNYIRFVQSICEQCKECYERWKRLDFSFTWPPGTFPPPLPMTANALA